MTMQEKVVFDTNIYIGIFNRGQFTHEINWFNTITYLVHPVLHELWMGAKGKSEINHLIRFGNTFIKLGRLVQPDPATQIRIGRACQKLRAIGKLDPGNPRQYNDVCIALLARQIGATVITRDISDFKAIRRVVAFRFRDVTRE
jgi:predicted nucleic acid-binding protein